MITNLHEKAEIRTVEDTETGELFYSIVDVIYVFRDCFNRDYARNYWAVMKNRLGSKKYTSKIIECISYKAPAKDGKYRATDFADFEHVAAIIEYMSYSKVRLIDGTTSKIKISSADRYENAEYVKCVLDKYTRMPRTKYYFEGSENDPDSYVYIQDSCRRDSAYIYGTTNEILDNNTDDTSDDFPCQTAEEFIKYLETYYPICKT